MKLKKSVGAWLVVVAILAGLTACAAKPELVEPADEPGGPVVTLKSAGASPKQTLRFVPRKDYQCRAQMTMEMAMEQTLDGKKLPAAKIPTMQFEIAIKLAGIADNGDISLDFTYENADAIASPGIDPRVLEAIRQRLKGMNGIKGHMVVSNRGFTKAADFEVPADADAMVKQQIESMKPSMNQMCSPLPREPVGVGAVWETEYLVTQRGFTIKQVATLTLLEVKGNVISCQVGMVQSADPQDIHAPGAPQGASLHLDAFTSSGHGETTLRRDGLWPSHAAVDMENQSTMTIINGSAAAQKFQQRTTMSMKLSEQPPADKTPAKK